MSAAMKHMCGVTVIKTEGRDPPRQGWGESWRRWRYLTGALRNTSVCVGRTGLGKATVSSTTRESMANRSNYKWSSTANTQIPGGLEGCKEQRLLGPVQEDLVCESHQRQSPFWGDTVSPTRGARVKPPLQAKLLSSGLSSTISSGETPNHRNPRLSPSLWKKV